MPQPKEPEILLIRDGAVFPPDLPVEDAAFLPGWRMVKNIDSYCLCRKIAGSKWKFPLLRGGSETRVVGRARPTSLRQSVAQVLEELKGHNVNSPEIIALVSRPFLGVKSFNIAVHLRHPQCSTAV